MFKLDPIWDFLFLWQVVFHWNEEITALNPAQVFGNADPRATNFI